MLFQHEQPGDEPIERSDDIAADADAGAHARPSRRRRCQAVRRRRPCRRGPRSPNWSTSASNCSRTRTRPTDRSGTIRRRSTVSRTSCASPTVRRSSSSTTARTQLRSTPRPASGRRSRPRSTTPTVSTPSGSVIDGGMTWSTGTLNPGGGMSQVFTVGPPGVYLLRLRIPLRGTADEEERVDGRRDRLAIDRAVRELMRHRLDHRGREVGQLRIVGVLGGLFER